MSTSNKRIYLVTEELATDKKEYMVRAGSQSQAIRYVASGRFMAAPCSTDDALRLAAAGVAVVDAGVE